MGAELSAAEPKAAFLRNDLREDMFILGIVLVRLCCGHLRTVRSGPSGCSMRSTGFMLEKYIFFLR